MSISCSGFIVSIISINFNAYVFDELAQNIPVSESNLIVSIKSGLFSSKKTLAKEVQSYPLPSNPSSSLV